MKQLNQPNKDLNYPDLNQSTRDLIEELCKEAIDDSDVEGFGSDNVDQLEFERRDGFIPYSHNHGGVSIKDFTDIGYISGSGNYPSHKGACAEIERQVEYAYKCAKEYLWDNHEPELRALGIDSKDHDKLNYNDLCDLNASSLAETLSECESENMSGDYGSIMYEVQFMYHGVNEAGLHEASVSCAVNTEGPYHRRSISWAPNVFCEGAHEVQIEWTTDADLETKLRQALNETSSEVF